MAKIMIGEDAGKQLLKIPLSNNTISRRIDDISEDINNQLINSLRRKEFGIQLDEATDSHKDANLICYVRYVNENQLIEDLLFCKEIEGGTSGKELFDIVNNFMAENDINWEDCVGVCTDGGRSMSGHYQGLQSRIREKAPNAVCTHCIIHREALAAAKFSSELSAVIKTVIQVINFIKTRPMKARFFSKLCDDTGAQHSSLLYYSSARWLSLGNSLLRLFELRQEIHIFLSEDNNALADMFIDESFLLKLAFLTDIFERLNILNKSLQGNNTDIFQLTSKVEAFKKKLVLWEKSLKNGDCSMFSTLNQLLKENDLTLKEEMKTTLTQHLSRVQSYFEDYLPKDEIKAQQWVNDPFQTEMPENFSNEEA
ncbi:protein FAM200A-like [Homalodisca vitripennis]|uniref:protein FAM200A-like n=1 Tax=Homalodisca vitripennis TaxID=197043 RepID=UPI001EEC6B9B|nr:protein FAM200A-like [Homalodisca vitripennis]